MITDMDPPDRKVIGLQILNTMILETVLFTRVCTPARDKVLLFWSDSSDTRSHSANVVPKERSGDIIIPSNRVRRISLRTNHVIAKNGEASHFTARPLRFRGERAAACQKAGPPTRHCP
ncbi:hypothetical protein SKAU_G00039050 [Synaphobranchus kaupii]|uniref:Uncharacterized protein n=1 Tax=Synaphobranchus kaupii TaxID=118154 RepID=A0A9Q1JHF6_SYNKA|nr:hypothetical protein SKAU_G00039050 [Synaphobranchus kaupii]